MKEYCYVVFTKPVPGMEAEFNRWYDTRHIPDVLAVPGFESARRFATTTESGREYLALYTIRTDAPEAALAELESRAGTDRMAMTPALDLATIRTVLYEALEPVQA